MVLQTVSEAPSSTDAHPHPHGLTSDTQHTLKGCRAQSRNYSHFPEGEM